MFKFVIMGCLLFFVLILNEKTMGFLASHGLPWFLISPRSPDRPISFAVNVLVVGLCRKKQVEFSSQKNDHPRLQGILRSTPKVANPFHFRRFQESKPTIIHIGGFTLPETNS